MPGGMAHVHDTPRGESGRALARRRLRLTLALTGTIFVAEVAGGFYSGSLALLSDAGHMLGDLGALVVSYFALLIATRPANARRTYGYYRAEILAALVNALALLLLTGFIGYEAIQRLIEPHAVLALPMVAVAVVGLVANGVAFWLLRSSASNLSVRSALLHVLGDLVSSIAVIAGGAIMWATGNYLLDPLLSLVIAILIVVSAVHILREAVEILLEATPAGIDCGKLGRAMMAVEGVAEVHDLHVWSITSGMYAMSGHVIVPAPRLTESHRILDELKHVLLVGFSIDHTTIQIEPEGYEHVGEVHAAHDVVR